VVGAVDLNDDGSPDLVVARDATEWEGLSSISVFLNRGDGNFRARQDYDPLHNGYGYQPGSVAIGDVNDDGRPDLVVASDEVNNAASFGPVAPTSALAVLLNRGDGRFRAESDYRTGRSLPDDPQIGDLNGDGRPDLAVADFDSSSVSVMLNTPGRCDVQYLKGLTLAAARSALARVNCRVGKIRRRSSNRSRGVRRARVISQSPGFGAVKQGGATVDLVVSLGRG